MIALSRHRGRNVTRVGFEALAADNLDIGRADNVEIIFNRQVRCVTKGVFRTAPTATTTASSSTPSTGTPASRPTSNRDGRCGWRPSSTTPTTTACCHGPGRRLVPDAGRRLRPLTARLLGASYSARQMTYDLRRLRLNGPIRPSRAPTPTC